MLKQNYPAAITHTSTPAVAENNTSKGISLPAVSPLQKMDAAMEEPLGEPAPIQMKAHLPPKFILQKTLSVENNVLHPFQLKAGAPVVQRTINILPGAPALPGTSAFRANAEPASPHSQGGAQVWNAQQAYARLPAVYRTDVIDQQLLLNVLGAMDAQNWSGTGYRNFCQEVANRYNAVLRQQQQPPPQHETPIDTEDVMEDSEEEEEDQGEVSGEEVSGEPAYPAGIEKSEWVIEFKEESGKYGARFVTGFISSSGEEEDLEGIQIREVIEVGRNDLEAPSAIETQQTVIDENGMLNDYIGTDAARIHRSVPRITNFPAVYETPQRLEWKYAEEDANDWKFLANIAITVTVVDKSKEGDEERHLTVITTYNGESVEQRYRGAAVPRP